MAPKPVFTWDYLSAYWDDLSENRRELILRHLLKEYRCRECQGVMIISGGKTWVLHEVKCRWRNNVRVVYRPRVAVAV